MIGAKGLPTLHPVGGGIEAHVENLSRHLCDRGHDVTVYVRKYANPKLKKSHKGIKLITLPSLKTKHLDTITHVLLASIHALTVNYDIQHYHGIGPSTLCWIPRVFKRSARVVTTFRSSTFCASTVFMLPKQSQNWTPLPAPWPDVLPLRRGLKSCVVESLASFFRKRQQLL